MKKVLIALFALFALFVLAMPGVMAAMNIDVDGSSNSPVSVMRDSTVPIKVTLSETSDYQDVTIEAQLRYEHGKEVEISTQPVDVIAGTTYTRTLNMKIPANIESTVPGEEYALTVSVKDGNGNEIEWQSFDVTVQRTDDQLEIQKVLKSSTVEAGKTLSVTAVVKNTGSDKMDDIYVTMSIPELGLAIEKRLGDLVSVDTEEKDDTKSVLFELKIPSTAKQGTYTLELKASNDDTETVKKDTITVVGAQNIAQTTDVYASKTIGSVAQGKTTAYDLTLLNVNGDAVSTYTISVQGIDGWATAKVTPDMVTVYKDTTAKATVYITANADAVAGQHIATVTIKSGDSVIKQMNLVTTVTNRGIAVDPLFITAIILAIILLVLIVVFVKTRKGEVKLEEESYY
jgi:uncharacterized membrane protein